MIKLGYSAVIDESEKVVDATEKHTMAYSTNGATSTPLSMIAAGREEATGADRIGVAGNHEGLALQARLRQRLAEFLHGAHRALADVGRVVVELDFEIDLRLARGKFRNFLALAEPERWDAYFAAADLPRAAGADFWVGGRRYGLFAHDFRQVPVDALLELVTERALGQDVTPSPPTVKPPLLVLSQPEFDDAVRQALRDLRRPDLLSRNPLLRTRLVRDRTGHEEPSAATLEALVCAAVATLGEHPRDDKLWRAVERTYVRPAATQERAAAALGLPFSTYRRHLTQGVDRVVAWLWDQEVYGSGEHH